MNKILETERLNLREINIGDAEFILNLLNQPSFIKNIGDRNVRTIEQSRDFIENRFRESYEKFGFGLWTVELKTNKTPVGICGFVKRDFLADADIGFAFLPEYEKKGYAFESAASAINYGKNVLNLKRVLAITSQDNENSQKLLEKLGFKFEKLIDAPNSSEKLNLFSLNQPNF